MIERIIEKDIPSALEKGKMVAIMGPRQVGKSTLIETLYKGKEAILWLNGDDSDTRSLLENITSTRLRAIIGTAKTVIIDEAQKIPGIGDKLKLITDQMKEVRLIISGSSSFELSNQINESLTGRKRVFNLFPISFKELCEHTGFLEENRMIRHRMIYGYYPEVVSNPGDEKEILKELIDSYLYKDILSLDSIYKSDKLVKMVQALAFQIGSQVSYNELSQMVGIDAKTVEKYIDILEKCYILFRLPSFAKNLRNELKYSRKFYFYDMGIRNAIIGNFAPVEVRDKTELGHIWENFVISERMKKNAYDRSFAHCYFWRTQQMKEIDLVELVEGEMYAYEMKWDSKTKVVIPKSFSEAYPKAHFRAITPNNLEEFLL